MSRTFGEFLQRQIDEAGINAAELGRRLGITNRTAASNWINDKNTPSAEMCLKIAFALNLDEDLVSVEAGHVTPSIKEIVRAKAAAKKKAQLPKRFQEMADSFMAMLAEAVEMAKPVRERFRVVPIRGCAAAGRPLAWEDEWIGETEIAADQVERISELFALRISGDSMSPEIPDGSVAVFGNVRVHDPRKYSGRIVAAEVASSDGSLSGTVKRVRVTREGVVLESLNPSHPPQVVPVASVRVVGAFVGLGK